LEDAERLIAVWNERQALHAPMIFSPTIGAAIRAGYWFLWVRCPACRTINAIDLRRLDRHPDAAVTSLIPALSCRSCLHAPPRQPPNEQPAPLSRRPGRSQIIRQALAADGVALRGHRCATERMLPRLLGASPSIDHGGGKRGLFFSTLLQSSHSLPSVLFWEDF